MGKKKLALLLITATTLNIGTAKIYAKNKYCEKVKKNTVLAAKPSFKIRKGKVVNITSNLRIRENATTSSQVIGYLVNGEMFEIQEKTGEWYKVKVNGKIGFIHEAYVKELDENIENKVYTEKNNCIKKGEVVNITTNLRIREKPSTTASIIGYLLNGQIFDIKGHYGDWDYIDSKGKIGYIHRDYVKELENKGKKGISKPSEKPSIGKGEVINVETSLRIREKASTNSSILGYLKVGDIFDIRDKGEDWSYITYKGIKGYIHNAYIKEIYINKDEKDAKKSSKDNYDRIGKVINTTTRLRVRKEPNTNCLVVAYLMPNETFRIKAELGNWYYTEISGAEGYVFKDYVQIIKDNDVSNKENKEEQLTGKVINVTTSLRIRQTPSANGEVIGYLLENESIEVIGKVGHWYKIKHKGLIGYVSKAYITIN
ncbi:SH3 domain-containing protein [Clostridium tarantellae]|uniref:SH3 domain-containing protein n=1 Tax=Clostridium tarantellae TaxID=39493 RepID=A0A6I1MJJ0_9CLOT|nr:SH3 domain-containing protein [Clostridium tarantellae]MPQ42578.1 SH3 domain-containing protein [Clostridium tarantellae]